MPHSHSDPAVGIDLGTTFSVIAHVDADGRPITIPNSEGDSITPSVVLFDDNEVVVGKEAVKSAVSNPNDVVQFIKREMGNVGSGREIHGRQLPPEVIQSFVLKKLSEDASLKLGRFQKVVISVPAFFNEPRRKATQDAGSLAGLEVLDIINEPTAAAIAYGVQGGFLDSKGEAKQKETILIYDLGGGTFDVTLMEIQGKNYTAIATAGDVQLGGIDWDRRIVDFAADAFAKENGGIDPRRHPSSLQRLLKEAEDAKRTLSAREQAKLTVEHDNKILRVPISRNKFEELSADLIERTRFTSTHLIKEAGLRWSDLTRVLVVGGSSRMPAVLKMLGQESGKPPDRSLSPDEAVAHGAAIYAGFRLDSRTGKTPKISVRNINSHNLGVLGIEKATNRPRTRVMIPRNTKLPTSKAAVFVTNRDDQKSVVVNVVEGGDPSGNDATQIGKCVIRDLPHGLPAGTKVRVLFSYDDKGLLHVRAQLPQQKKEATLQIERASGLTAENLSSWNNRIWHSVDLFADEKTEPPPLPATKRQMPNATQTTDEDEPPPLPK